MHERTTHQAATINAVVTAFSGPLCKDTRDAHKWISILVLVTSSAIAFFTSARVNEISSGFSSEVIHFMASCNMALHLAAKSALACWTYAFSSGLAAIASWSSCSGFLKVRA